MLQDWRALYASNRAALQRAGIHVTDPAGLNLGGAPRAGAPRPGASARPAGLAVHVPPGLDPGRPVPLVLMLHGCTQDAASFAAATGIEAAAERHGVVVAHPEQERRANAQCCWNWFEPAHQSRGGGEPAALAAHVTGLLAEPPGPPIDPGRVWVCGISAGGAMAAVLAAAYPELVAAVAIHSGIAYRAAAGVSEALAVMSRGAPDPGRLGADLRAARGERARVIPAMVVHGTGDRTVAPVNGRQVLAQHMGANGLVDPDLGDLDPDRPVSTEQGRAPGGRAFTRARWVDDHGALVHELLSVEGMGHAWSGGRAGASFADPAGPDATEAILTFFAASAAAGAPSAPARRNEIAGHRRLGAAR